MAIDRFFVHPFTRLRAGTTSGRGSDVVADWTTPDELDGEGWITQVSTEDVRTTGTGDSSRWVLSTAADFDLVGGDRIRRGDHVLRVIGHPRVAQHPERGENHLVADLELVEG